MTSVLLINQAVGTGMRQFPCAGKSTKVYGQAFLDTNKRGVVLKMTLEDYEAAKFDLIGNTFPLQQWIPEFVTEADPQPDVQPPSGLSEGRVSELLDQHKVPKAEASGGIDLGALREFGHEEEGDKVLPTEKRLTIALNYLKKLMEKRDTIELLNGLKITRDTVDHGAFVTVTNKEGEALRLGDDIPETLFRPTPPGLWFRLLGPKDGQVIVESRQIESDQPVVCPEGVAITEEGIRAGDKLLTWAEITKICSKHRPPPRAHARNNR